MKTSNFSEILTNVSLCEKPPLMMTVNCPIKVWIDDCWLLVPLDPQAVKPSNNGQDPVLTSIVMTSSNVISVFSV